MKRKLLPDYQLRELIPKDKFDLERVSTLASLGYPEIAPILPELLEWMQDGNWPVSQALSPFLASIGKPLAQQIRHILQTQDHIWKYWVLRRIVAQSLDLATALYSDLVKITEEESNPLDEDAREVKEAAKEILHHMGC